MPDFDDTEMMMDGGDEADVETTEAQPVEEAASKRVFKVGGTTIHEDSTTAALTNEAARDVLKGMYPEIANATIRETVAKGTKTVEFLPQPGRKG
jgi:PRTRC genetic system protein C